MRTCLNPVLLSYNIFAITFRRSVVSSHHMSGGYAIGDDTAKQILQPSSHLMASFARTCRGMRINSFLLYPDSWWAHTILGAYFRRIIHRLLVQLDLNRLKDLPRARQSGATCLSWLAGFLQSGFCVCFQGSSTHCQISVSLVCHRKANLPSVSQGMFTSSVWSSGVNPHSTVTLSSA